jgi:hypothetical protein
MNEFNKILFFEKEYEKELKVKDYINNNFTSILTLMTVNITILSYFIINTPIMEFYKSEHNIAFIVFFFFSWCYFIYFLQILIHFYSFYFRDSLYMKIPYANQVSEYFDKLHNFNEKEVDKNINKYLLDFYINATSVNSKINEYKSDLQYKIRKLLFIQFIILFIIFFAYYVIMDGNLNTYNIRIKEH